MAQHRSSQLAYCLAFVLSFFALHTQAKVNFHRSCDRFDTTAMFRDTANLAGGAATALQTLGIQPGWRKYSLQSLFSTLFDASRADAKTVADGLISDYQKVADAGTNQDNIIVICDEGPMFSQLPNGEWGFGHAPADYVPNGFYVTGGKPLCSENDKTVGWSWDLSAEVEPGLKVIMMCVSKHPDFKVLSTDMTVNELDTIPLGFWSFTLGHELLHVVGSNMLSNAQEAYGFDDCYDRRSTNGNKNPDSLMLFAYAASNNNWIWGSGYALSKDSAWQLNDFGGTGAHVAQLYGLTQP